MFNSTVFELSDLMLTCEKCDVVVEIVPGHLLAAREVIIPDFDDRGVVVSGTMFTEITYSVFVNEPKRMSIYLLDALIVNPLHMEK